MWSDVTRGCKRCYIPEEWLNGSASSSSELDQPGSPQVTSSAKAGVEHVVLERGRIGESWRRRWDNFCLVTPNWTVQLPRV